jgi:hypothetical protein
VMMMMMMMIFFMVICESRSRHRLKLRMNLKLTFVGCLVQDEAFTYARRAALEEGLFGVSW